MEQAAQEIHQAFHLLQLKDLMEEMLLAQMLVGVVEHQKLEMRTE